MNLKEFFRESVDTLTTAYTKNEAEQMLYLLMEKFSGTGRQSMITMGNSELLPNEFVVLQEGVKRLLSGEPVQYVTGEAWFYHLPFNVDPRVLIPRPETEELVEKMLKLAQGKTGTLIDIGTGSGCIPVAFLKNAEGWNATAVDVSAGALEVAKSNAAKHSVNIRFFEMDFLETSLWEKLGKYDIICSNPPYIPEAEINSIEAGVKDYEPHLALFVPEALLFYKKIAAFGKTHLNPAGTICMETHRDFAAATARYFMEEGYRSEVVKDMSGNDRMVFASQNP